MTGCSCGVPSQAAWRVEIVYGSNSETDYEDGYFCADHKPRPSDLKAEGRETWKILEHKTTRLTPATSAPRSGSPSAIAS